MNFDKCFVEDIEVLTMDELDEYLGCLEYEIEMAKAQLKVLEDRAAEEEDNSCHNCLGTGEGMYDGARCDCCGGRGFFKGKKGYYED